MLCQSELVEDQELTLRTYNTHRPSTIDQQPNNCHSELVEDQIQTKNMERNPEEYKHSNTHYEEDEIDLIALAKTLWEGRKTIIKTTIIFACIGLFVALTTPAEYTSTVVVKPILSDSKANIGGSLGGLAAMAGINLGGAGASAEIHPTLYPKIVESYGFQKELMQTRIYVEELEKEVTFEKYYTEIYKPSLLTNVKRYTIGLPGLLLKKVFKSRSVDINSTSLNRISEIDQELFSVLDNQMRIQVDEIDGSVGLSAVMPEKVQCAQMVNAMQIILQREVIEHKLKKATEDLRFIEDRYYERKKEFEAAQSNLARYRDANKSVNSATALTEMERLESEYQLTFSVYSELAKQVETQKIQVKENTPVFVLLQEAIIPFDKSNIPNSLILLVSIFLGGFIGIGYVLCVNFVSWFKKLSAK